MRSFVFALLVAAGIGMLGISSADAVPANGLKLRADAGSNTAPVTYYGYGYGRGYGRGYYGRPYYGGRYYARPYYRGGYYARPYYGGSYYARGNYRGPYSGSVYDRGYYGVPRYYSDSYCW